MGEVMTHCSEWLCKPKFQEVTKIQTQRKLKKGSNLTVGRKDTSRMIVGLKVEDVKERNTLGGRKVAIK